MKYSAWKCLLVLVTLSSTCPAATITVALDGAGDYEDIQAAIDAAADGDTVLVGPGEYTISRPLSFNDGADPVKNLTLRSDAGPEQTTIRMAEVADDPDQASVVVFWHGENEESVLEGFTLTGGRGTLQDRRWGGGVLCVTNSSPRIVNCLVAGNTAEYGGGVLCWNGASPTIQSCTIKQNVTEGATWTLGAGLCCGDNTAPTVIDCEITENAALGVGVSSEGGGVFFRNCSPTMTDCSISHNRAGRGGGVLCLGKTSDAKLTGCTVEGNVAFDGQGGGVCCYRAISPRFTNCRIVGNYSVGGEWSQGAGFFCGGNVDNPDIICTPELANCIIAGNRVDWNREGGSGEGGGVYCYRAEPRIFNCTITANMSPSTGGVCCNEANPAVTNCIVWGNTPDSLCGTTSHCLSTEDPLFLDPGEFNFDQFIDIEIGGVLYPFPDFVVEAPDCHLQPSSPCIDAGTPEGSPATDIEGNGRPCGAGMDIGAYEFGDCSTLFIRGDANADGNCDLSDAVFVLNYLFLGGPAPSCEDSADSDDNGILEITDAVYILNFLFRGGPEPEKPFPTCGLDPRPDELGCDSFVGCSEEP